jgi:hypothetical protein
MGKHQYQVNATSGSSLGFVKRIVFSLVAVCLALVFLEGILALFGVKPEDFMPDPYVGFESTSRLFVESPGSDGALFFQKAKMKKQYCTILVP